MTHNDTPAPPREGAAQRYTVEFLRVGLRGLANRSVKDNQTGMFLNMTLENFADALNDCQRLRDELATVTAERDALVGEVSYLLDTVKPIQGQLVRVQVYIESLERLGKLWRLCTGNLLPGETRASILDDCTPPAADAPATHGTASTGETQTTQPCAVCQGSGVFGVDDNAHGCRDCHGTGTQPTKEGT